MLALLSFAAMRRGKANRGLQSVSSEATNRRLFIASFLTLIAAGMGFAIRGGVLGVWQGDFGFTKEEVGAITGGGLTGFGVVIILCSIFADKIGYKPIMMLAFVLHILSAIVTVAATPVFESSGKDAAYWCLFVGMFMFAVANGLCEAVINPLTATLYPKQKTHYLNILHAGWPGGLILGGVLAFLFVGNNALSPLRWEVSICLFLVPTLMYGLMIFKEKFPESEARAAGINFGTMLKQFASPVLLLLLLLHAMVGYVELGTDSWITNIMNNVISGKGVLLFIYTSTIMFVLRFFAGPIIERINPVGLLFISGLLGAAGLFSLGTVEGVIAIVAAATVYGLGKTFLWPTMLGVVGERFPKGGALTMGVMGGIGMLSAGQLATREIGREQDYYATRQLKETVSDSVFNEFIAYEKEKDGSVKKDSDGKSVKKIPVGLDGGKAKDIMDKAIGGKTLRPDEQKVLAAGIYGGRMALKWTALVPAMMAVGYLLLLLYFRSKGGYKAEVIHDTSAPGEEYTGGVEGPGEY